MASDKVPPDIVFKFQAQLARIQAELRHDKPHAPGPKKPTLGQQERD